MAEDEAPPELDREAILARRRRFIALAISGLATAGCDKPLPEPQPCLSVAAPEPDQETGGEAESPSKPFVEDPGVPLASETGGSEADAETTGEPEIGEDEQGPVTKPAPRPCLNVAPKPKPQQAPRPCLLVEVSAIEARDEDHG